MGGKSLDYICVVLDDFASATGRLQTSPADYQQARDWQVIGIPLSCVQRGIQDKLSRTGVKHYTRTMPLSWCHSDVLEVYGHWKRAVGPSRT